MPIHRFPDPKEASPEGVVAVGGDLHPDSVMLAYRQGIFPWPLENVPFLPWFCPPQRAILDFSRLHIPKSLLRIKKKSPFLFSVDQAFTEVISECAFTKRPGQSGTWINPEMEESYCELHRLGHAHSVEVWKESEGGILSLVGGIYGVDAGGVFAAESMFYRESYASKLALLHLIEHLQARGAKWMDIQIMTPHMLTLGAHEVSRDEFLEALAAEQGRKLKLFGELEQTS